MTYLKLNKKQERCVEVLKQEAKVGVKYLELKMQQCMRDESIFQNLSSKVRLMYLCSLRQSKRRR